METLVLDDMIGRTHGNIDIALAWHLGSNHYPPVMFMLDTCREAITLALGGELDTRVDLPDGVTWLDSQTTVPVWAIIEDYHLEDFLEDDNDYLEV